MREMINYMIEANIGLLLFLAFYKLFLDQETTFRFMRFFMLVAILISVTFPLIHIENNQQISMPAIERMVPANWLPEVDISNSTEASSPQSPSTARDVWQIAGWVYGAGVIVFFTWLVIQLVSFLITTIKAEAYSMNQFKIIESE